MSLIHTFSSSRLALTGVLLLGTMWLPSDARADNGQCKWEGGLGSPTYAYCSQQDCFGEGGFATCAQPVPKPGNPDRVDANGYVLSMCNDGLSNAGIWSLWCHASGGTWQGASANPQCAGLDPSSFYTYGGPLNEDLIDPTATQFASGYLGCASPTMDERAWGATDSYHCWSYPESYQNGILARSILKQAFSCQAGGAQARIYTYKAIELGCPDGYTQRKKPGTYGDIQCYIPADATCRVDGFTQPGLGGNSFGGPVSGSSGGGGSPKFDMTHSSTGGSEPKNNGTASGGGAQAKSGGSGSGNTILPGKVGDHFRHTYEVKAYSTVGGSVVSYPGGIHRYFDAAGNELGNRDGAGYTMLPTPENGWVVTTNTQAKEFFDADGDLIALEDPNGLRTELVYNAQKQLEEVVGPFGHSLVFSYSAAGLLESVVTPDNQVIGFRYNAKKALEYVDYADGTSRRYHYENASKPFHVTGITDELGVRYATWTYDAYGRVTESKLAGDANKHTFSYTSSTRTRVTDPLGKARDYDFAVQGGFLKQTSVSQQCTSCGGNNDLLGYDANGNVISRVMFGGRRTNYVFDLDRNLETLRTEGLTASGSTTADTRTIATTWHASLRLPVQREHRNASGTLVKTETMSYDAAGNLLSRSETADGLTRTTTYQYDALGRRTQMDGPRTDVQDITTWTYYAIDDACTTCRGQLHTVQNALGHTTTYEEYDAAGRVLAIRDPNGSVTRLTYDARGRVVTRTADADGDAETTTFVYLPTGSIHQVISPASTTTYGYDDAHRLTSVQDALGNRIEYTLDRAGNRIAEDTKDAQGVLKRSMARVYNDMGRLIRQVHGEANATHFEYTGTGDLAATLDALNGLSTNEYDALGRLRRNTDSLLGDTEYDYDSQDRLTAVTDAEGKTTEYVYNGLGDLLELRSPDTGVTLYQYDAAGQRSQQTDARSQTASYTYDLLGRVRTISYADASLNVAFDYDQPASEIGCAASHSIGRLTRMTDASGSTTWCYDQHGRATERRSVVGGQTLNLGMDYDTAGRLSALIYPSGGRLEVGYDAAGRIASANWRAVGGALTPVATNMTYLPFGPMTGIGLAHGASQQREYDDAYQLVGLDGSAWMEADARQYQYDAMHRLQTVLGVDASVVEAYSYDGIGNRVQGTADGVTKAYTYASDSHRLVDVGGEARGYDAAGNTTAIGAAQLSYDVRNRLAQFSDGPVQAQYAYNGRGERVRKSSNQAGQSRLFAYDDAGHLIGEYDLSGAPISEVLWLGDLPVAVVRSSGVLAIEADALNTPRALVDSNGQVVWSWSLLGGAFGDDAPNADADGDGQPVEFGLRFPGQYFDAESGLHYNYFRDYDPLVGRYIESDPLGLAAGFNSYWYSDGAPMDLSDPLGLAVVGSWSKKPFPEIYAWRIVPGAAYRPDDWWMFWRHGGAYAAAMHQVDVKAGFTWAVSCREDGSCVEDNWTVSGGWSQWLSFDIPIATPVYPRIGFYVSAANLTYNLLVRPATSRALKIAAGWARAFYESNSATQICLRFPRD